MSDFLNGLKRTDMCGSLRSGDIGRQVTIMGWVVRRRDLGNLIFVQVRDKTGVVQAVFDSSETEKALFDKAFSLRQEYVVAVGGEAAHEIVDGAFAVSRCQVVDDKQFHGFPFRCGILTS